MTTVPKNYINHIALVLDASGSMANLAKDLAKVADAEIKHLVQRSKELDQETRITVYTFADTVECIFYDMDVLRLPSIASFYRAGGNTALIDATCKAIEDLGKTPELYGDHSFLIYVLTDGEENRSRYFRGSDLAAKIALKNEKGNWTIAAFVPNVLGRREATQYGFPIGNVAIWSTDARGVESVGSTIRATTDTYMRSRASGVRGSSTIFSPDVAKVSPAAVRGTGMRKLGPGQFRRLMVRRDGRPIAEFVELETGRPYVLGEAFYLLTKRVVVQAQKKIALYEKATHTVFVGDEVRKLLGLPDYEIKVEPADHPLYDIFVQSTSVNRKLFAGTHMLLISQAVQNSNVAGIV